jgi:selenoprotein W-related protein
LYHYKFKYKPESDYFYVKMKPTVTITYCPDCGWLLRAAYIAQELLTTFRDELKAVSLQPGEIKGTFFIQVNDKKIFDRKDYGGFPEIKELKQWVRDEVAPGKSLGHADTKTHRTTDQ